MGLAKNNSNKNYELLFAWLSLFIIGAKVRNNNSHTEKKLKTERAS